MTIVCRIFGNVNSKEDFYAENPECFLKNCDVITEIWTGVQYAETKKHYRRKGEKYMGLFDRLQDMPNLEEGIKKVQATPGAVLLDVRSVEEYRQGHLEGSVNLPINQIPTIDISKDTPIFVYCLSGARSKRAEKFLQKNGYQAENIGGLAGYKGKLVV